MQTLSLSTVILRKSRSFLIRSSQSFTKAASEEQPSLTEHNQKFETVDGGNRKGIWLAKNLTIYPHGFSFRN